MAADESNQEDDGMVPIGLGCANEEFKEVLEVKELLDSLPNVYNDQIAMETMRGSKVVVRLFPHEVVDVEPVLALLYKQDPKDFEAAETRYILLLWLSMACMIPFDLVRLDSNVVQESGDMRLPVMDRIYNIAMEYLTVVDKSRNAAAYLMSRFMTRPDVKKRKLTEFMDWALKFIENAEYITMTGADSLTGVLTTIGLMFKHGKREDLLQYAPTVLEKVVRQNLYECNNNRLRKYGVKVVQRLGTTFLPSRVAKWSKEAVKERIAMETTNGNEEDDDEDYDIPEEMEEVIEMLLTSLKDKDTIVRWSAAKGIGRITGRLPKELADEVVGSLLELFNLQESDGAWHGGCLALAELGRRGLLLPVRLPDVVPIVLKALAYDERRGTYSVGAHVRDAACYVCWAFARAYEPKEIAKYVNQIASLLIASIFDREVNVRRAASAAFQENVGRQGTFPHGIDILTKADYYAVGNRTHCYLDVSVYIAEFSEYTEALINHLADVKVHHWDSIIRELTAKALHNLTEKLPEHMAKTVLPQLLTHTTGLDLHSRHGTILAVAEITHALSSVAEQKNKTIVDMIDKGIIEDIKGIAAKMAALSAIQPLCNEYYQISPGAADHRIQEMMIEKYLRQLRASQEITRQGHSLALGALPEFMLRGKLRPVLAGLIQATQITDKDQKWAEGRRDALKAITRCEHVMCSLVQQCCEKIDRTRAHAGNVFSALLYHEDVCKSLNWAAPCDTFPLFTQLIKYPTYTYSVILGLAVSVGGITGFLVKHSSAALHSYLRNVAKDIPEMTRITSTITKVFKDYQKVDRVSLPMLKMLDQLLSKGCFDSLIQEERYCDLLQFPGEVRRMCLSNLCIFLCHRFPRIRKTTANKLYEVLVTYDDIAPEENVEELMTVLSETLWDEEIEKIKPVRNNKEDSVYDFKISSTVFARHITVK
ncbi:TBCD-like protein [Mya arenaria]|uniref:Tubulin-specific chaperone D n=1 Tax=Mya arenaria TaxID=6604 RepID=A0ABY7DG36_MYAAR|nr:TBCD-like protein [Mya arenaria]